MARTASAAYVFADFDDDLGGDSEGFAESPSRVPLAAKSPMRREWTVVCDSSEFPVALVAWEIPGQVDRPEVDRCYESIWTVDPLAVREASRVCAAMAAAAGADGAADVVASLDARVQSSGADNYNVTSLFNRVIAYVDAAQRAS